VFKVNECHRNQNAHKRPVPNKQKPAEAKLDPGRQEQKRRHELHDGISDRDLLLTAPTFSTQSEITEDGKILVPFELGLTAWAVASREGDGFVQREPHDHDVQETSDHETEQDADNVLEEDRNLDENIKPLFDE
jgi:hypothetical protein